MRALPLTFSMPTGIRSYLLAMICCLFASTGFAQPAISSFSAAAAPPGGSITITGNNFSTVPANNIVFFGPVKATVTNATANTLTVTVPLGATYYPVTVTVNGLTAYSPRPFNTTYADPANLTVRSFEAAGNIATDLHPNTIVAADFDGDGKPDLATANNYWVSPTPSASVSILRNTSSGGNLQFAAKQDLLTGVQTYAVAAADLDGDGKPDLISSSLTDFTISVFRNTSTTGNISFGAKTDYSVSGSPYKIVVTDLNGDGKPELIVANGFASHVTIFTNISTTGNVVFNTRTELTTGFAPEAVAVGDLDGDNKPDIVTTNSLGNNMYVFRNTSSSGTLSFATKLEFVTEAGPYDIAIGDLDGDDKQDIALSNNGTTMFTVFRNTGSAGTISFAPRNNFIAPYGAFCISLGDVTGDGKPDVVLGGEDAFVTQNTSSPGNLSFTGSATPLHNVRDIAIADLNADGRNDLAGAAFSNNYVALSNNRNNAPNINTFNPATAAAGDEVTITGYNFTGATGVSFGGQAATSFTVVNATTIKAIVSSGLSGDIEVTNAHGKGKITGFVFAGPPTIQSFTPTSLAYGGTITITGTNFYSVTGVSFGGQAAQSFSVVSATTITAVMGNAPPGNINVSVTNTWGTASFGGFYILPSIYSFSPTSAATGATVTITGANLTALTDVVFGGVPANSFTVVSATSATAVVGNGASGTITIGNAGGTATISGFTYIDPPVITDFTPAAAGEGMTVTITGNYFTDASQVSFGGKAALSFKVVSPTTITARLTNGSTGIVSVTTPGGTATKSGFTFVLTPLITSFRPLITGPGGKVTITGSNLSNATSILFGGTAAASYTVVSPTTIEAIAGAGTSGDITVSTAGGTSTLGRLNFTTSPVINTFLPASGAAGSTVTISGANFSSVVANNIAYIGTIKAAVTAATANSITITVPAGVVSQPITVIANGLSCVTQQPFKITFPGGGPFTAASFAGHVDFATGMGVRSITAGDIDGDGKPDMLVANWKSHTISIFRNTSTGGKLSFAPRIDIPAGVNPYGLALGDIDGDGKLDIGCVDYHPNGNALSENKVSLFRNISTPGTIALEPRLTLAGKTNPIDLAIADLNGDGKQDLIIADANMVTVTVYRNTTTSNTFSFFQRAEFSAPNFNFVANFERLIVRDMNNDERPDIVVGNTGTDLMIMWNDIATPDFIGLTPKEMGMRMYSESYSYLQVADFNDDYKPDIISKLHILTNNNPGKNPAFSGYNIVSGFGAPGAAGDMNGDTKLDYIKTDATNNAIMVHRNHSDPSLVSFADGVSYETGKTPYGVCIADFNMDGKPDIATPNFDNNTASVLLNATGVAAEPAISSFTPTTGVQGTSVTINGTGFTGATAVYFGEQAAASFTVNSNTKITAVTGAGSSGNVRVVTAGGDLLRGWFTFIPPAPTIASFTPTTAANGATVTVTGTNFTEVTSVQFGNTPAYTFTVNSSTSITATILGGATGNVAVTTPGGTITLGNFTYLNPPLFDAFTPASAASADTVILKGKYLTGITQVSFGGVAAAFFTIRNDGEIAAVVGAGSSGNIKVSGPQGSDERTAFTYLTTPVITGFTPVSGPAGSIVVISGYNFTGATVVSFGDIPAASFVVNSATTITATVGQGATGAVKVITPQGTYTKAGFTVPVVTAIGSPDDEEHQLNIYPNPAHDRIVVSHPAAAIRAWIRVTDINGKVVKTLTCNRQVEQTTIFVNTLAKGIYKITWSDGKKELTRSLLVY
jgi:hypothetical protein